ncbi:hypothetical protein BN2364_3388 [Alloalcanivorax xenomutans]|nr:hypothetical protein BN2364_3388 [Alloalcanivorax xenomutans]
MAAAGLRIAPCSVGSQLAGEYSLNRTEPLLPTRRIQPHSIYEAATEHGQTLPFVHHLALQ